MSQQVAARARRAAQVRRAPDVHDVVGRPHRRRAVPGQGRDPVRPGRRRRRHGRDRPRGGLRRADRLRHGRHLDRRVALRRRIRARLRDRGRGRAHARADDADPHGRGRRRLDPAFRRRALPRRAGFGRRQSRAEMLPPRRAARRHRRQRAWSASSSRISSRRFSGRTRTSRSTPTRCAPPSPNSPNEVGDGRSPEEVADGFIKIAVENMANAIKKISVQRGYDVTRYALNCFGGAGGQHACLVADALGMTTVLIHPFSSLLSAYGMGLADIRATRQQAIEEMRLREALEDAGGHQADAARESRRGRRSGDGRRLRREVRMRSAGVRPNAACVCSSLRGRRCRRRVGGPRTLRCRLPTLAARRGGSTLRQVGERSSSRGRGGRSARRQGRGRGQGVPARRSR